MIYKIVLDNKAIEEIDDAFSWYESQKSGLGMDFMVERYDYLDVITQSPQLFPIDFKQYRLCGTQTILKICNYLFGRRK